MRSQQTPTPDPGHRAVDGTIAVERISVHYGDVVALDSLDLHIGAGTVLGVLGPNGAGKSSLIECLIGYRRPDSGRVRVLGTDPWRADSRWRARVGVVLQDSRTDADLTVREYLDMVAGYYGPRADAADAARATRLDDQLGQRVHKLSGGQRRRVELAVALVGRPDVVFLDEPTSGLDPEARRDLWRVIAGLRSTGRTVVLTTHQLDEAEALADRVVVIDHGRIVRDGTVEGIRATAGLTTAVRFSALVDPGIPDATQIGATRWEVRTSDPAAAIAELGAHGIDLRDLDVRTPSLEDVYLQLVGRADPATAHTPSDPQPTEVSA
ncbi:MAG: ATP-binding cassette domain-containing protein [Desertimonas sp.]